MTLKRIILLVFLCLLCNAVVAICFNNQLYRDVAGVYAWYARDFGNGIWRDQPISKVPSLNIFLAGILVYLGMEAYQATILLSLTFMALTVFPLYRLLQLFCSSGKAAFGCLLWATAPRILRFAGMGLLESARDFFLVSATYLLLRGWRKENRWYHWLLFGAASGGLVMARGEGIIMAGFLFCGLLVRPAADYKTRGTILKNIVRPILLSGIAALAVLTPVSLKNYKVTGYPVADARMIGFIEKIPHSDALFSPAKVSSKPDSRILQRPPAQNLREAEGGTSFLEPIPNIIRGANELYFALALLGVALLLKQKKWQKEYTFLLLFCIVVSAVIAPISAAHRYFIFVTPLCMFFTLTALEGIFVWAQRHHCRALLLALFAVIIAVQPWNAWLYLLGKGDADELKIKQYINELRPRLRLQQNNRQLIIHGDMRMVFLSGEDRLFHYGENPPAAQYITGFDILLVAKKNKYELDGCMARKDLCMQKSPFKKYAVFVPREKLNE